MNAEQWAANRRALQACAWRETSLPVVPVETYIAPNA